MVRGKETVSAEGEAWASPTLALPAAGGSAQSEPISARHETRLAWWQGSGRQARAHVGIGVRRLSTFCKKTSLCSGCHWPRLSTVSFEKW